MARLDYRLVSHALEPWQHDLLDALPEETGPAARPADAREADWLAAAARLGLAAAL